ncbi:hypothetical protein PWT90_01925 [Aphanocladium album]|nr:hypothetical protein PWT90_01925 [Aphanocladium album]
MKLQDTHKGVVTRSPAEPSDYFEQLCELAKQLISCGKAYANDTDVRFQKVHIHNRLPSARRDRSAEESLAIFYDMRRGTDWGKKHCTRARIQCDNSNGSPRDPIIYQFPSWEAYEGPQTHQRTGWAWSIYPTYDFACPPGGLHRGRHAHAPDDRPADAASLANGEEIPLMHWGNAIIKDIVSEKGVITNINAVLNLEGDVSKTKKLQWLASNGLMQAELWEYGDLLTNDSLAKKDILDDSLILVTCPMLTAKADWQLADIAPGSYVRLERKGYYRVDRPYRQALFGGGGRCCGRPKAGKIDLPVAPTNAHIYSNICVASDRRFLVSQDAAISHWYVIYAFRQFLATNGLEISPNNRAGCKDTVCKKDAVKITKGEIRFGTWVEIEERGSWSWKHWGCVSGDQMQRLHDQCAKGDDEWDFDEIDGYDELEANDEVQEKVRRCVKQAHIDAEDFKGDPEKNKPGVKGIRLTAKERAALDKDDEVRISTAKTLILHVLAVEDEPKPKRRGRPSKA